jgi:ribosome biogenesis GTPase
MKRLLSECKFYNCTHIHEPGCAIKQAVEEGEISEERYTNYISIINTEEVQQEEWKTK